MDDIVTSNRVLLQPPHLVAEEETSARVLIAKQSSRGFGMRCEDRGVDAWCGMPSWESSIRSG